MFEIEYENYEQIKNSLEKILTKIKEITEINVNGKFYNIKFFLGGDLKFLSIVLGIKAANSHHCCPWCHFDKSKKCDLNKKWDISRTHEIAERMLAGQQLGYQKKALFDFITFENCVIDILHLLLRVTDQLFISFLAKINTLDGNQDSPDFKKRPNLSKLNDLLKNQCKISKPFRIKKKTDDGKPASIKIRSLNGNERLKILNFFVGGDNMFQDHFEFDLNTEQVVWEEFLRMFNEITNYSKINKPTEESIKILRKDLKQWCSLYLTLKDGNITPYVHAFVNHVPEFLEQFDDVNIFNLQGLEKFNDFSTIYYHRSTNKQRTGNKYLEQLLKKRNRIEFYNMDGNVYDFLTL
jgi:hypothetical protein